MRFWLMITFLLLSAAAKSGFAADYNLVIQPVLSEEKIRTLYQPLADYLSKATGERFHILSHRNFLTYWERMKKAKGFDFVLDAAHFTDYRVQKMHYTVLAKLPETVSFSVITGEDDFVFDMNELVSRKIATLPSPGLGAIRLDAMFPNPMRLPIYIQVEDSNEVGDMLKQGLVDAAIIPSPMVASFEGVNTVVTTEPVPHMALSASPDIADELARKVQAALVDAVNTPDGRKMLELLNLDHFELATNKDYEGYSILLEGVFGY